MEDSERASKIAGNIGRKSMMVGDSERMWEIVRDRKMGGSRVDQKTSITFDLPDFWICGHWSGLMRGFQWCTTLNI